MLRGQGSLRWKIAPIVGVLMVAVVWSASGVGCSDGTGTPGGVIALGLDGGGGTGDGGLVSDDPAVQSAIQMIEEGRNTFRFDTFGDEAFWGDTLKLHQAIAGAGQRRRRRPASARRPRSRVGLKVDVGGAAARAGRRSCRRGEGRPRGSRDDARAAQAQRRRRRDRLLRAATARSRSIGIQCALCHSTVDDSFAPGIGRRLDGWANRDLNVGAIIALAPDLSAVRDAARGRRRDGAQRCSQSWGPGKFDAELILDGKAFRPDGKSAATLIPPAFGLAGVNLHTYTGWGSVTALERVRRQPRDARAGDLLRSAPRRRRRSSRSPRANGLRPRAQLAEI